MTEPCTHPPEYVTVHQQAPMNIVTEQAEVDRKQTCRLCGAHRENDGDEWIPAEPKE